MSPPYVYWAYYLQTWGLHHVEMMVDLGFGRSVRAVFELADVGPVQGRDALAFIDTWMREDRRVLIHVETTEDDYRAYVYRGADCLNVALREYGYAVPARMSVSV